MENIDVNYLAKKEKKLRSLRISSKRALGQAERITHILDTMPSLYPSPVEQQLAKEEAAALMRRHQVQTVEIIELVLEIQSLRKLIGE